MKKLQAFICEGFILSKVSGFLASVLLKAAALKAFRFAKFHSCFSKVAKFGGVYI